MCVRVRVLRAVWPRDALGSRGPANVTHPVRLRNQWSVDHDYFKREAVGMAHRIYTMKEMQAWA